MARDALTAFRGIAIPTLSDTDTAVWRWIRTHGVKPGAAVGTVAFDTSQALRCAESVARRFPINPTGL